MKAFKAFIKPFEAPQKSVKIKISLNFFPSSGIETERVKVIFVLSDQIIDKFPKISYLSLWPATLKILSVIFSLH